MLDAQFLESFIHQPHSVMGVRLVPFSLRHLMALDVCASPFLDTSKTIGWPDIEIAVTICSLRNPLPLLYRLDRLRKWRVRWIRTFGGEKRKWTEAAGFVAYLADYHAVPETAEEEGQKNRSKTPWILRVIETLRKDGIREEDAWAMPSGEALWRYAAILENGGAELNILDEDEKGLKRLIEGLPAEPKVETGAGL